MLLKNKKEKFINYLLFLASFLTLLIFFIRFSNSISISEITHVLTSGYEEESLLAIWYNLNDFEVYHNHLIYPYRWSIYNWLFYEFYSIVFKLQNYLFDLNYLWLPTYLRLLTFIGMLLIFPIILKSGYVLNEKSNYKIYIIIILLFGLSFGYWNFTVRPDIYAILFEALAILFFLKKKDDLKFYDLIYLSFLLYLAWSFKQTSLVVFATINLFFLINGEFKKNIILSSIFIFLSSLTIFVYGEIYFKSIYFLETEYPFEYKVLFYNLSKLVSKNIIFFTAILLIFFNYFQNKKKINFSSINFFLSVGLIVSSLYWVIVNTNAGSSDNHSFILLVFIILIILKNEKDILNNKWSSIFFSFSILVYCVFCVLIISGKLGRLSPNKYQEIKEYQNCTSNLKGNIYIDSNYYSLPWITTYNDPSVETFNYKFELEKNNLENGGHEGLIREGFYDYLIIFKSKNINLEKYTLIKDCEKFKIFKSN